MRPRRSAAGTLDVVLPAGGRDQDGRDEARWSASDWASPDPLSPDDRGATVASRSTVYAPLVDLTHSEVPTEGRGVDRGNADGDPQGAPLKLEPSPARHARDARGALLDRLRARSAAASSRPTTPTTTSARRSSYGDIDRAAVIVRVADAADVASLIDLARENGLELAVRSGGHSAAATAPRRRRRHRPARDAPPRRRRGQPDALGRDRPDGRRSRPAAGRARPGRRFRRHRVSRVLVA